MRRFSLVLVSTIFISGCSATSSLSPVQLIGDTQSDVAIQEFLIRSRYLAYQYDLLLQYSADAPLPGSRGRVNRDLFGFPIRAEVPYAVSINLEKTGLDYSVRSDENRQKARADYIKAGAYASMILCRNYLSGLRDRNEYFEFLQKELSIAGGITNIALQLASANGTIRTSVTEGLSERRPRKFAFQMLQ